MAGGEYKPITVSRRIGSPASVEIFDCSGVPEDERADIDNGSIWVESMHRTLQRLDGLCTGPPEAAATPD